MKIYICCAEKKSNVDWYETTKIILICVNIYHIYLEFSVLYYFAEKILGFHIFHGNFAISPRLNKISVKFVNT